MCFLIQFLEDFFLQSGRVRNKGKNKGQNKGPYHHKPRRTILFKRRNICIWRRLVSSFHTRHRRRLIIIIYIIIVVIILILVEVSQFQGISKDATSVQIQRNANRKDGYTPNGGRVDVNDCHNDCNAEHKVADVEPISIFLRLLDNQIGKSSLSRRRLCCRAGTSVDNLCLRNGRWIGCRLLWGGIWCRKVGKTLRIGGCWCIQRSWLGTKLKPEIDLKVT